MSKHCWHPTGTGTSHGWGGSDNVQCCHCGLHGYRGWHEVNERIAGHGPHASKKVVQHEEVRVAMGGTKECPGEAK